MGMKVKMSDIQIMYHRNVHLKPIQGYARVGIQLFIWKTDMQVMIIAPALLTQQSVTHNCKPTFAHPTG